MAFALIHRARLSLAPPLAGRISNDAAGFASCYGPLSCSPLTGLSTLGFDPGRFPTPPACYRASWQLPGPDFHRQATTSLRNRRQPDTINHPSLLDALANRDGSTLRGLG